MFFATKQFLKENALTNVAAIEIQGEDLNDPHKLKMHPKMKEKIKEV